jgi:hypothetical protein
MEELKGMDGWVGCLPIIRGKSCGIIARTKRKLLGMPFIRGKLGIFSCRLSLINRPCGKIARREQQREMKKKWSFVSKCE